MRGCSPDYRHKEFTLDLAKANGTYDITTAVGSVLIVRQECYVTEAASSITSVEILTNDTTPVTVMTAAEGALANLTIEKNLLGLTLSNTQPFQLRSGKKIQYKIMAEIVGDAGEIRFVVEYRPVTPGAYLS